MKVAMLTKADWAGSGFKTCQAINKYTEHTIELFAANSNMFGHPTGELITKNNKKFIQDYVNNCDIIHLKGDHPPQILQELIGININNKPIIITTSGGFFRKKKYGGQGRYENRMYLYKKAQIRTSFEPDLLYPEYGNIWTPHPIDSIEKSNIWKQYNPPIITHSPSDRRVKNTEFLLTVLNELKKKIKFKFNLIEKVTFQKAIELKKESTIFADQFNVGFYGNSAIEVMQYGIPVVNWISPMSINQANGKLNECPIQTIDKNIDSWVNLLLELLTSDLNELSRKTKQWCDKIHSYQSIAKIWDKLYKSI